MTKKLKFKARSIYSGEEVYFVRIPRGSIDPSKDEYQGSWSDGEMVHCELYNVDVIDRMLVEGGTLELTEIIEEEQEQMKLPDTFYFLHNGAGTVYTAAILGEKCTVSWCFEGAYQSLGYDTKMVERFVEQGIWVITTDYQTEADEVVANFGNYNFTGLEENFTILSADAEDEITVQELRDFAEAFGAVVEIDQDFYVINLRGVKFSAVDVSSLRRVMGAIAVLDLAANG